MTAIKYGSGRIVLAEVHALRYNFSWMNELAETGKKEKSIAEITIVADHMVNDFSLPTIEEVKMACEDNWDFDYYRKEYNLP